MIGPPPISTLFPYTTLFRSGMAASAGSPTPEAPGPDSSPAASQAPKPDSLYKQALTDYNQGKYDLSSQEFTEYIKYYSNTDLAGNAVFYLADIEYRQGNFEAAARDYDKVLEQYPGGTKAAAAQRSEEHTSELQSLRHLVCRLL